jgi:UDP-galactopyranose mutase
LEHRRFEYLDSKISKLVKTQFVSNKPSGGKLSVVPYLSGIILSMLGVDKSILKDIDSAEVIVVGSGFFGSTIAERVSTQLNRKVVILEKRQEVGGNAHTYIDNPTGIEVHKYGSHLFHTQNERVWNYITSFSLFNNYQHRVFAKHYDNYYSLPINLHTISQFFGKAFTPNEAINHLSSLSISNRALIASFRDKALELIGSDLYSAFFKNYTEKQWQTNPDTLSADIFSRLPVRFNFNSNYFSDTYQGLPVDGYHSIFARMLENRNIVVHTGCDALEYASYFRNNQLVIYTGPIDRFFSYRFGPLNWRTLDFDIEMLDQPDFQGTAVINYVDSDVPFTRIHEFKHMHPERPATNSTIIMKEFSRKAEVGDEPYYPVNSDTDRKKLLSYRQLQSAFPNFIFGGRLGSYKYLDMHMAIASALQIFDSQVSDWFRSHR